MKISALVIAHNEERYIGKCLDSLMRQTLRPDEIVLIAHNCNDRTEEIAQAFQDVRIVSYHGPVGTVYARIKGFEEVTGEIVVCTDGDSYVDTKWIEKMTKPFADPKVSAVNSFVLLTHSIAANLASYNNYHLQSLIRFFIRTLPHTDFWGASFAVRMTDYEKVGGLMPLIGIREKLQLNEWAEDYYLYLALREVGTVVLTYATTVRTVSKLNDLGVIKRSLTANVDAYKLTKYFKNNVVSTEKGAP